MFQSLYREAQERSDVRDGNDGFPRPNFSMSFARDCEEVISLLRTLRGEPYYWPLPWRSDTPARPRLAPRPSRFSDLEG
jgi:hypothetical protein